ncbi:hypothetical protein F2Q65_12235 [Thiohalocapsa marina]|uniref:Uncharacterized protein n=1 Tax=Thiohalocapsa marina TaxID=424902 RepID=A0A5M8FL47_9GAMM|nr:hypothetical protein [Thiohalocapsa marina]KAA6184476.1 hypothetical protein F2Q65_12235 [Thiohalocapsa marina]
MGTIGDKNQLAIDRLKKGLRQTEGKPRSECDDVNVTLLAMDLRRMSEQVEWVGVKLTDEEKARYREAYAYVAKHGVVPFDCIRPECL